MAAHLLKGRPPCLLAPPQSPFLAPGSAGRVKERYSTRTNNRLEGSPLENARHRPLPRPRLPPTAQDQPPRPWVGAGQALPKKTAAEETTAAPTSAAAPANHLLPQGERGSVPVEYPCKQRW